MTDDEFRRWLPETIAEYAAEHASAGSLPADEALERARRQHTELLFDGVATAGQHLFTIEVDGEPGGVLWLGERDHGDVRSIVVFQITVWESLRGNGVGRAVMMAAEEFARTHGAAEIRLHVFGANLVARRLYDELGYQPTNITMAKALPTRC